METRSRRVTCCLLLTWLPLGAWAQDSPDAKLVDVGGHRLSLTCTGEGSTTVVLESGHATPPSSVVWGSVTPELAGMSRVCHYDRAGYFKSETGPEPRTARRLAQELHQLLANAGEAPPFVLVGHSFGGVSVRAFASEYPDQVTGLVLVESVHEDMKSRLAEVRRDEGLPDTAVFPSADVLRRVMSDYPSVDAAIAEWKSIDESLDQLRAGRPTLASVPLVVIARGETGRYPGVPEEKMPPFEDAWRALQRDLASVSGGGRFVVAENSSHNVPIEEPGVVVQAVQSLLKVTSR